MRSLARRLLPVTVFAIAVCLVMTGMLSQVRSRLDLHSAGRAAPATAPSRTAGTSATGVSDKVGAIPGLRDGSGGQWHAGQGATGPVIVASQLPIATRDSSAKGSSAKGSPAAGSPATGSSTGGSPATGSSTGDSSNSGSATRTPEARNPATGDPATRDPANAGSGTGRLKLHQADVLVVAPAKLPASIRASIRRLHGVVSAISVDAGRIKVNGAFVNVLGVNPATFRLFAAGPTARSAALWRDVAAGGMAISFTMGRQDKLTLSKPVRVTGSRTRLLPVAGFGTVGIGGVDAVVSGTVARSLGLPRSNAIVISAPKSRIDTLIAKVKNRLPARASVAALVTQVIVGGTMVTTGAAGDGSSAGQGSGLTATELATFLAAAKSRLGMPYVWGAAGPTSFDCSGLVQWAMAQAGVVMPRVAADQARTGPLLALSDLRPGDLLFYHTDPTAPGYISHVAIYLGHGLMIQAPEPGMNVEVVAADFGAGFAGAVRVLPAVAAGVAASPAG